MFYGHETIFHKRLFDHQYCTSCDEDSLSNSFGNPVPFYQAMNHSRKACDTLLLAKIYFLATLLPLVQDDSETHLSLLLLHLP